MKAVPAGVRWPSITFSFRPKSGSTLLANAASVNTLVVSWKDAAEMNDSLDRLALVMPSSTVVAAAGLGRFVLQGSPPRSSVSSFTSRQRVLSTT